MILLPSQKNALYDYILGFKKFSPSMFSLTEDNDLFTLSYLKSNFYFKISHSKNSDFNIYYSPANTTIYEANSVAWESLDLVFRMWLTYLQREVMQVDKWGRLFEEMSYLHGSAEANEHAFSHTEFLEMQSKFAEIKRSILTIPLLPDQIEAINNKLDHLLSLTTELNKFDWQNLFIGTIVSVIIQLGITQENAQLLYALIKQTFHGLFLQ